MKNILIEVRVGKNGNINTSELNAKLKEGYSITSAIPIQQHVENGHVITTKILYTMQYE